MCVPPSVLFVFLYLILFVFCFFCFVCRLSPSVCLLLLFVFFSLSFFLFCRESCNIYLESSRVHLLLSVGAFIFFDFPALFSRVLFLFSQIDTLSSPLLLMFVSLGNLSLRVFSAQHHLPITLISVSSCFQSCFSLLKYTSLCAFCSFFLSCHSESPFVQPSNISCRMCFNLCRLTEVLSVCEFTVHNVIYPLLCIYC